MRFPRCAWAKGKRTAMTTAIVLAAGHGKRMGTDLPKQFLEIGGVPMIAATLRVFEESSVIDEILLVTSPDYVSYCENEIVAKYGFSKVRGVITGGKERYDSVWQALLACEGSDYVFIHDGARPFVTGEILLRTDAAVRKYKAAAVAVPSKDTVKIADENGFVQDTPSRSRVFIMQTPQAFEYDLIRKANEILFRDGGMQDVTDDAMIVERSGLARVKLVEGSYSNIKITTPEDLKGLGIKACN